MNADASVNAHQSRQVFKTFTGEVGIVTKDAMPPDCIEEKASVQSGDARSCLWLARHLTTIWDDDVDSRCF